MSLSSGPFVATPHLDSRLSLPNLPTEHREKNELQLLDRLDAKFAFKTVDELERAYAVCEKCIRHGFYGPDLNMHPWFKTTDLPAVPNPMNVLTFNLQRFTISTSKTLRTPLLQSLCTQVTSEMWWKARISMVDVLLQLSNEIEITCWFSIYMSMVLNCCNCNRDQWSYKEIRENVEECAPEVLVQWKQMLNVLFKNLCHDADATFIRDVILVARICGRISEVPVIFLVEFD